MESSTYYINAKARIARIFSVMLVVIVAAVVTGFGQASAYAGTNIPVGHLANVSVFANIDLNNNGNSTITGDVDINAVNSLLGIDLPLNISLGGLSNIGNGVTAQVKTDCDVVLNAAVAQPITLGINADLAGRVLLPGVYSGNVLNLNGTLTLDAGGDPNAVFILNANAGINLGANAVVKLINGASSARVFWTTKADATLGVNSHFVGRLLSIGNILAKTGSIVNGSLLSCDGNVNLNTNIIDSIPTIGGTVTLPTVTLPTVNGVEAIPPSNNSTTTTSPLVGVGTAPSNTSSGGTATGQVLGDDVMKALTASSGATRSASPSGILAYTGRNALPIFGIGAALAGIGWAIVEAMKRRKFQKMHPEI